MSFLYIAVCFLFLHKFTDHCHRVEIQLQEINITSYISHSPLKFGSEAWVMKKREEQRLEAAQMKFLRHLLGIAKLDKEKKPMY